MVSDTDDRQSGAFVDEELTTFRIHAKQKSVENIYKQEADNDTAVLYKTTDQAYSFMSTSFKSKATEKLVLTTVGNHVPATQLKETMKELVGRAKENNSLTTKLEQKSSQLNSEIKRVKSLENEIDGERVTLGIAQQHIDRFNKRIRFLESTLAWKIRRRLLDATIFFALKKISFYVVILITNTSSVAQFEGFHPIQFLNRSHRKLQ